METKKTDIHFPYSKYGIYGSGLDEPFSYLGRIISERFQAAEIAFPYQEIEIQRTYFSPKQKKNETYMSWYNKLPIYYRGKNMVRVIFAVENKQIDLVYLFQLIYKAFDIIISKKKKADIWDTEKVKSTLIQLEKELQEADLWEINHTYEMLFRQEAIAKTLQERTIREQTDNEKKRLIYDLRFYYHFEGVGKLYFSPYDNQFCNSILEKLRERKFRLPGYTHVYIRVSDSFENALFHATRLENWFAYGIAVFENYADYPKKTEDEKKRIVFNLIKQGLNDIAKIDKLDTQTLNEVLDEVEQNIFNNI